MQEKRRGNEGVEEGGYLRGCLQKECKAQNWPCVIIMGQFVSMLTSHSSWGEWFPPRLEGLTYLTSHIFTMVASAPLWGWRSEFQTS
ncbi:unnamed protein product [Pleuronectes platessa]|uniref:Uncharacterized protein n=1 Tax=Pleuronectes platessa TaxID=8262 RepID=A0A9N7U3K4_PLEPL|nr:unnamed protein product [Pleuronectes platessa]